MSRSLKVISIRLGCVVAPTLAVLAFAGFVGEPSEARASGDSYTFVGLPDVSGVDLSRSERVEAIGAVDGSPMWFVEVEHALAAIPGIEDEPEQKAVRDPVFVLSAVLPSNSKPLAVVNGKPHREGDVIVPGWRLRTIDGSGRAVVLEHDSGRAVRVTMSR